MDFETCFHTNSVILMEGALGERLKHEYSIAFDDRVAMAGLVYQENARQALSTIFGEYAAIAKKYGLPFIATTPTRRANRDRVRQSAYSETIIEDNMRFLQQIKSMSGINMFVGGLMGCKGDAYKATEILSAEDAYEFHSWQVNLFKKARADFLYAGIMPAISEAIGMAKAMESSDLPYMISFMIRSDGKLIDGTSIHDAIMRIDRATVRNPICYMTNCVHPTVLAKALSHPFNDTDAVRARFRGIQANASPLSAEELDDCCTVQCDDPKRLAESMMDLYRLITPKIIGGCCGTDNTHMEEIAKGIVKHEAL